MKYINQLEHRDIPYEHNLDHGGVPEEKRNVAAAGCGPSCLCMMVDALTLSTYELTDCLKLSNEVGANREIGTSLKILGPVVAERFNLNYGETSDLNELKAHPGKRRTRHRKFRRRPGRVYRGVHSWRTLHPRCIGR